MEIKLYNEDCFEAFKKVPDKSVNLFLLDLPYGQTACKWDSIIDLDKMWKEIKRTLVKGGIVVMFCTTKFGFTLIQSNPKWFKYDLVWKKSKKVGFLSANKMPLRQHEMVYIFKETQGTYNPQKTAGKPYKKGAGTKPADCYIDRETTRASVENKGDRHPTSIIEKEITDSCYSKFVDMARDNKGDRHPTSIVEKEVEYNGEVKDSYYGNTFKRQVSDPHAPKHPTSIVEKEPDHEMMYVFKEKQGTYNPQKIKDEKQKRDWTKTKPRECNGVYGNIVSSGAGVNEGYRHPTSVVEPEPDHEMMYVFKEKQGTYNPQKVEGKPYDKKRKEKADTVYGEKTTVPTESSYKDRHPTSVVEPLYKDQGKVVENIYGDTTIINKTDSRSNPHTPRHPTSVVDELATGIENTVLDFKSVHKTVHKTQKPVELCEWLIKSYSNEGDMVMDFCMGSGTAGVASKNTKRNFIGVEMDDEIFKIAKDRIE